MAQPRYRSRSNPEIEELVVLTGYVTGSHGPFLVQAYDESISDWVTSDYKTKIAEGAVINNPCDYTKSVVEQKNYPGTRTNTYLGPGSSHGHSYTETGPLTQYLADKNGIGRLVAPELDRQSVEDRQKLVAIANVDSTPYAFGEDIGELKETLELLRHPVAGLYESAKTLKSLVRKKRRLRPGLSHAKALASAWNEVRFGWSPLVRSAYQAIDAYQDNAKTPPVRRTANGNSGELTSTTSDQPFYNGGSGITNSFYRSYSESLSGHASILYTVSNPVYDWKWRLGLRFKDIPTTAWQLARLSFMVDRLVDISSFSRGIINLIDPNVKILAGSYTERYEAENSLTLVTSANPNFSQSVSGNVDIHRTFAYNRSLWSPSVADTIPNASLGYVVSSASKIADLVAITISHLR